MHLKNEWEQCGFRPEAMPEQLAPMSEWTCSRLDPEKPPPEPCPDELLYVWDHFSSLNRRRTSNGFGLNAITSVEIEAWARLHRITLSRFDVEALEAIESHYLRVMQPKPKTPK